VCLYIVWTGYPPFLPQMPPHVGLPPELCPRELLPLSAAAAAALGSISPGASLPYVSRPSLVSSCQHRVLADRGYHVSANAAGCLCLCVTLMYCGWTPIRMELVLSVRITIYYRWESGSLRRKGDLPDICGIWLQKIFISAIVSIAHPWNNI